MEAPITNLRRTHMPRYANIADKIAAAADSIALADQEFEDARTEFEALSAEHAKLHGAGDPGTIKALIRTYAPKIATYFGLPGLAAGLTATAADPGAFGVLRGIAGKFLGLFGFGG